MDFPPANLVFLPMAGIGIATAVIGTLKAIPKLEMKFPDLMLKIHKAQQQQNHSTLIQRRTTDSMTSSDVQTPLLSVVGREIMQNKASTTVLGPSQARSEYAAASVVSQSTDSQAHPIHSPRHGQQSPRRETLNSSSLTSKKE